MPYIFLNRPGAWLKIFSKSCLNSGDDRFGLLHIQFCDKDIILTRPFPFFPRLTHGGATFHPFAEKNFAVAFPIPRMFR
jgi:hypothetical protein